ncbi:unnamed protein product [Symbiodinium natans]|uniref:J domain-containing protein n=1 Tax=Symbiodinium natans TaxID=878477 RepID=A0A812LDE3_9DINO|nr:unnamed protein product [Symbiodinium natans]
MSWKVPQDWPTGPSPAPCDAWEGAEPTEAEAADAEAAAGDAYFAEEEIASWTGKQAVLWLLEAGNAFEALGLRPKPTPPARLRRRFLRLSLLTHPDKNNEPDAAAAFRKLSDSMRVVSTEQSQMDLLRGLFPRVYGVETTSADPAKVDGVYTTSRTETPEEAAVRRELEAQIERALREEKERRDASEADDEQAQRSKRRRSLEAILQAQKLQRLGRAAKAQVARGSGKGVKLAKAPQEALLSAERPGTTCVAARCRDLRRIETCEQQPGASENAKSPESVVRELLNAGYLRFPELCPTCHGALQGPFSLKDVKQPGDLCLRCKSWDCQARRQRAGAFCPLLDEQSRRRTLLPEKLLSILVQFLSKSNPRIDETAHLNGLRAGVVMRVHHELRCDVWVGASLVEDSFLLGAFRGSFVFAGNHGVSALLQELKTVMEDCYYTYHGLLAQTAVVAWDDSHGTHCRAQRNTVFSVLDVSVRVQAAWQGIHRPGPKTLAYARVLHCMGICHFLTHRAALEAAVSGRPFAPAPDPQHQAPEHRDLWSFNPLWPADLPKITLSHDKTADAVKNIGRNSDWQAVALALGHLDKAECLADVCKTPCGGESQARVVLFNCAPPYSQSKC